MNTNPFILDEIGAAILYYYEEFEFECAKNNIRNTWKYEPVTGTSEEVEVWKKERDNYIRDREKYIALTLLDEYNAPGLVIATTNLKVPLDEALFRRFDDVIEIPMPQIEEREKLLEMTLSSIPVDNNVDFHYLAETMDGYSYANIVLTAQRAAKYSILSGKKSVGIAFFEQAINESSKF